MGNAEDKDTLVKLMVTTVPSMTTSEMHALADAILSAGWRPPLPAISTVVAHATEQITDPETWRARGGIYDACLRAKSVMEAAAANWNGVEGRR